MAQAILKAEGKAAKESTLLSGIIPFKTGKLSYNDAQEILKEKLKAAKISFNDNGDIIVHRFMGALYSKGIGKKEFSLIAGNAAATIVKVDNLIGKGFVERMMAYKEELAASFAKLAVEKPVLLLGMAEKFSKVPARNRYDAFDDFACALLNNKAFDLVLGKEAAGDGSVRALLYKSQFLKLAELFAISARLGGNYTENAWVMQNDGFWEIFKAHPVVTTNFFAQICADKGIYSSIRDMFQTALGSDVFVRSAVKDPGKAFEAVAKLAKVKSDNLAKLEKIKNATWRYAPAPSCLFSSEAAVKALMKDFDGTMKKAHEFESLFPQQTKRIAWELFAGTFFEDYSKNKDFAVKAVKGFLGIFKGSEDSIAILKDKTILDAYRKNPQAILKWVALFKAATTTREKGYSYDYTRDAVDALHGRMAEFFVAQPEVAIGLAKGIGTREIYGFATAMEDNEYFFNETMRYPSLFKMEIIKLGKMNAEYSMFPGKFLGPFALNPMRMNAEYGKWVGESKHFGGKFAGIAASSELLDGYLAGKTGFKQFTIQVKAQTQFAIEVGRPLDDLHEKEKERLAYLAKLGKTDVLGLLCSNPSFFYTSSNSLLFDRLKSDFSGRKITDVLKEYGLMGKEECRNIIFRAINYGRLTGDNGLFSSQELKALIPDMLAPMSGAEFDRTYFYLLANSLRAISKSGLSGMLISEANRTLQKIKGEPGKFDDLEHTEKAVKFLLSAIGKVDEFERTRYFDKSKYCGKDGKLNIVQLFDIEDVGKDHWGLTRAWALKYGKETRGANGELIYESPNARITLYMGQDAKGNQEFLESKMKQDPHMILTFRGHSFSLDDNVPPETFGNNPNAKILFLPGSCGSAGSIPEYISENSKSDLEFVANTSTGRGQVTNALLDIFIAEAAGHKKRSYEDILHNSPDSTAIIEKNGGNPQTLMATTLGELLLAAVYHEGK